MSLYPQNQVELANVAIDFVKMVDVTNGFVLVQLKSSEFWQPGLQETITVAPVMTFTSADMITNFPSFNITDRCIMRGTYDAQRDVWAYPADC